MKVWKLVVFTCFTIGGALCAHAVEAIRVPMSADHWHVLDADSMGPKGDAQFVRKEGFPQGLLVLKAGSAALDGLTFRNGTIEYDFKPLAEDMPGLQFRVSGTGPVLDGEEVYERLFGDERASNDGIQYVPMIHGFMLWNVYPQYQSQAPLVNGWNHVRLVVSGRRMKVYVNHSTDPTLSVGNLESGAMAGALHVRGPAIFANLVVTPDAVDGLPPQAEPDPSAQDAGIVRHWTMSQLQPLTKMHTPAYSEMPTDSSAWRTVDAERGGLLNLNRQYTLSNGPPFLIWLRYTVNANHSETKRVQLGWIGEAWVYVNGKFLTEGKNFYDSEGERRDPDGRMSFENGSFDVPLRTGSNEIAVALYISEHDDLRPRTPFGWGTMMRFCDSSGLSFPRTPESNTSIKSNEMGVR